MKKCLSCLSLAGLLFTGACSSQDNSSLSQLRSILQGQNLSERFVALFENQAPALELYFQNTKSVSRLLLSHESQGVLTWLSGEGATLKTRDGFVVGTRGFFEGLQAARIDAVAELVLSERAGYADRFHSYLDGNNNTSIRSYRCEVTPTGNDVVTIKGQSVTARKILERCRNLSDDFTNVYWVRNGAILKTFQWIGPIAGSLRIRQVDIYGGR